MAVEPEPPRDPSVSGVDARAGQNLFSVVDIEQAVARVDYALDLVQAQVADRFPNVTGIDLIDPQDGRQWSLALRKNLAGKVYVLNMATPKDSDHPESFRIVGRLMASPSSVGMIEATHVDNQRDGLGEETQLQVATLAAARLRSLLGIPEESEQVDSLAQLSADYIGLLRVAHATYQPWEPTDEQEQDVEDVVARIKAAVPDISEDALRKMVFNNPNANRKWAVGGMTPYDSTEFHVLALNWSNEGYGNNRRIAEKQYGVTQVEVDFLKRGAVILPPAPPLVLPT